ncbi:DUF5787 family protein [Halalkalicoccus jeotgali]|uniref:Uncharacterized protein n=1 Tax=Halalkalicoccus jeotgali (strain DSM 18796 / CECT 7217 / JCM 14584 / KCTC 4019 / B3) TaxID=795797 RepID=D8J868_HALJB|nr:DUF5787 family protein [Halalkalicoccus jeotgali]ADJ14181.1 hypothetical protein HacjB3_03950 [Halalkalicoccus jeotgali B3]ELY34637.1 hypothetical protein C497_15343 [Halalkalicoccus jeotgali B3]
MREFGFELSLCARLEREGGIVARQLGGAVAAPGSRILDVVHVEPGPDLDERAAITPERIPGPAIEADVGTGRARYWKDAFSIHPDRARGVVDRAVEVGFFERERRGGREYVRQTARYPDWFGPITAIENKPDLGSPGDLDRQLRFDVSLGLVDRVVLATESYVTRAHLNRLPEAVGVWRVVDGEREVVQEPTPLDPEGWGVELRERTPLRTDVSMVSPARKARKRRRIAERAYAKGWRSEPPACTHGGIETVAGASVPYCTHYDRIVDPGDCGPGCPGYDPDRAPEIDLAAERERRTPWVADPAGRTRRQTGLDRFST